MYAAHPPRTVSAALSVAIVGLIGAGLILGLGVPVPLANSNPLVSISLLPPPPSPPHIREPPRPHIKAAKAKDKPSPRNIKNQATQVVAPPVVQPLIPPPPIAVATQAGVGTATNTGASNVRGPGQGAGGNGNGLGGGGDGGGDGDSDATVGPRPIVDRLSYRDLPEGMLPLGQHAVLEVLFKIEPDGHVTHCQVAQPSGYSAIDSLTCRLIEQRYRFRPARDEDGRPVRVTMVKRESWLGMEER